MLSNDDIIGFIGGGNMAEAMIRGLIASNVVSKERIRVSEPFAARRTHLSDAYGIEVSEKNSAVAEVASVLVLAVKPDMVGACLEEVEAMGPADQVRVSIAAGVPLSVICPKAPQGESSSPVPEARACARVMPNTPALVGAGASAVHFCGCDEAQREKVLAVLKALGPTVVEVAREELLDAVTGLSGSGPAYVFEFIEALSDGGVRMGLTRAQALELAAATVEGAARMVRETGIHPAQLKDQVTSPGGTTIAGCAVLEAKGFRSAAIEAVTAAAQRSKELGKPKG